MILERMKHVNRATNVWTTYAWTKVTEEVVAGTKLIRKHIWGAACAGVFRYM